jgi:hypothetical protein
MFSILLVIDTIKKKLLECMKVGKKQNLEKMLDKQKKV